MNPNKLSSYDFNLPKDLIAQQPAKPADACRLLVLNRRTKKITDTSRHRLTDLNALKRDKYEPMRDDNFLNLNKYLEPGDVLVFNNSKVLPARLIGTKPTGGKVEILLLRQVKANTWECLVGNLPVKKQIGAALKFSAKLQGELISRQKDTAQIKFNLSGQKLMAQIFQIGQMPTPPYIKRIAQRTEYQNFFAKKIGSVAAPTAGLHFTPRIFKKLKDKGVQIEFVTLHVGLGTFQPLKEQDITKFKIHSEYFELDKPTAKRLNQAKKENRRIIAVGTTSTRVLESCASQPCCHGEPSRTMTATYVTPQKGFTQIYIYPGYKFKFVDALITNFHVPKSSLILLVSALAGTDFIKKAYQHAIRKKYRFYSFGDVMLIY